MHDDERSAIRRCQEGDSESFRLLVERYEREALGHAVALLGHREEARDAIQEAFLDAFRALGRFDASRRFYPWFYVLLRNRCLKRLRRPRPETAPVAILAAPADPAATESKEILERALASLEPADREIVTLRHLDGLSYRELADRLEIPIGTVMSRLHQARKRLRRALEDHDD